MDGMQGFSGCHADALLHVIFRMVVTPECANMERLVPLYTTMLTALLNVAPYIKVRSYPTRWNSKNLKSLTITLNMIT
eukprot:1142287-Pyramimonas_sp.AAC.1